MEKYSGMLALVSDQSQDGKMKLGVIGGLNPAGTLVNLSFADLSVSSLPSDLVLVLKDKNALYGQLLSSSRELEMQDFKVLLRVNMLQEKNSMSSTLQAMELLKTSPSAAQFATVSLSSQLGLSPQVSKTETQTIERRGR
ncbi:hypothetical protein [Pedobacter ghigonis]|uniref:hypothetical protein n=1 Tax=Pedobacter ghigonis TaxID=2730403 RepID=UPI0015895D6F|nr:hypothetical protein [Pedobacter ghigonis]